MVDITQRKKAKTDLTFSQAQRIMTVHADAQLYKDIWWEFRKWMKNYQDVEGFYGLHCNMPITPRQVTQGILKGTNALGLEDAGNRTLGSEYLDNPQTISHECRLTYFDPVLYFGVTFDNKADSDRVLPDHDEFVQKMQKLAASRDLLHPYLFVIPAFSCLLYPSCCLNCG